MLASLVFFGTQGFDSSSNSSLLAEVKRLLISVSLTFLGEGGLGSEDIVIVGEGLGFTGSVRLREELGLHAEVKEQEAWSLRSCGSSL